MTQSTTWVLGVLELVPSSRFPSGVVFGSNTAMFYENIKAALRKAAYDVTSDFNTDYAWVRHMMAVTPSHREEPSPLAARPKRRDDRTSSFK